MTTPAHRVVWTSVFSDGPGGGNPCPVVYDADDLSSEQMQELTRGFGVESAFVLAPRTGGDVWLRYFVPRHEMEMCVHATVASAALLGADGRLPRNPARIETGVGVLDVRWDGDSAVVDQLAPTFGPAVVGSARQRVLDALRISEEELASGAAVCSVSTSRAKLMVPLRDEATLDALAPDFELLWTVCDELDVTGFYPFARPARDADVAARQFPRRAGYDEDPATGVAAGALAATLAAERPGLSGWQQWQIAQGRAMGRPSLITAEAHVSEAGTVTGTRVGGHMEQITALS